jgi:hypothetical protein
MYYAVLVGERPRNGLGRLRGRAVVPAVTRRPITAEARPVHVDFVMDKVKLVRVSFQVLWFS